MTTSSVSYAFKQAVQLQGHLIDSLTLAKVIDLIQSQGGDYHLNQLTIGQRKNQLSTVMLTVEAASESSLQSILGSLSPYGVQVSQTRNVQTSKCTQAGTAPEGALLHFNLPTQAQVSGQWVEINHQAGHLVVVLKNGQPSLVAEHQLQVGDDVVTGTQGLLWNPA
jgi:hypothetical protein